MNENNGRRIGAIVFVCILAIAVAAMVFPIGVYYNKALSGTTEYYDGIKCVFGGQSLPGGRGDLVSGFNVGTFLGFVFPLIGALVYVVCGGFLKKGWGIIAPIACFLTSFILLFCSVTFFAATNGRDPNQYNIGVGPVVGAIIGICGFIFSGIVGIRTAVASK
ncbi:MAG: hypothetical protein HUJ61_01315 [Bacilli bacterium]|nr:hypothetical protein [Bacilli bacterium]